MPDAILEEYQKFKADALEYVNKCHGTLETDELTEEIPSMTERLIFFARIYPYLSRLEARAEYWNNRMYKTRYFHWIEQGKSSTQSDHMATTETSDQIYLLAEIRALLNAIKESKSCIQSTLRTKSEEMRHNDWQASNGG